MIKGIFVTATGTDVGKTYISALLVKKMRELGYNCGYYKPVLSGAEIINDELIPGDCEFVVKMSGLDKKPQQYASYIFKTPVSPHLAAEIENINISTKKIKTDFDNIKEDYDYIVTEGAGGIICPINLQEKKIILPDIIKLLNMDVIIVSNASLGSINSALLTVEYIKSIGINIRGIILNNFDENNFMQVDNKKQIENLTGIKIIATVKRNQANIDIDEQNLLSIFKEI